MRHRTKKLTQKIKKEIRKKEGKRNERKMKMQTKSDIPNKYGREPSIEHRQEYKVFPKYLNSYRIK
jgi:hypothetical protein